MRGAEYFELLEAFGRLVRSSVELVCRPAGYQAKTGMRRENKPVRPADMAGEADRLAAQIMRGLAADFITPLEREDISSVVLALRRAVLAACTVPRGAGGEYRREVAEACLRLAALVEKYTGMLRKLNKKGPLPLPAAYFEAARISKTPPGLLAGGALSRLYESLCDACEAVIHAVMGNI